ncbi:MAG: hypothetical protein EOP56_04305 [Sphingobacteriales bacterium]|nr:MAG: hypothetical protein EOP56_04305 [Sphingobacteriales bacterium]
MKKRLRTIVSAFSISFVIMAALSLYSMEQFSTLTDHSDAVDRANQVINRLYKIDNSIREFDTRERDYILTKNKAYADQLVAMSRNILPEVTAIKTLVKGDSLQMQSLTLLRGALSIRYANFRESISLIDSSGYNEIVPYLQNSTERRQECINYLRRMMTRENSMLHERFQAKKKYQQITSSTIIYLILIFGIITIVLFMLMIRELRQRVMFQKELQTKVVDLKRSHAELEQIAFAASHDLQEPLRKIRIFGNRLLYLRKDEIDEESRTTVERINNAAGRMQDLIEDMVNLTSLIKEEGEIETVDLNNIFKAVSTELSEKIEEKNASIQLETLPDLQGYPRQLHILFKSLLDNSIKFSRAGVTPIVNIRVDKTNGEELMDIDKQLAQRVFYKITISDNGIGFDNKFIAKMFKIFHQLHTEEAGYEGQGIGLAICQRIMVNHKGYITAHGHTEVGATFKLFFPVA